MKIVARGWIIKLARGVVKSYGRKCTLLPRWGVMSSCETYVYVCVCVWCIAVLWTVHIAEGISLYVGADDRNGVVIPCSSLYSHTYIHPSPVLPECTGCCVAVTVYKGRLRGVTGSGEWLYCRGRVVNGPMSPQLIRGQPAISRFPTMFRR